MCLTVTHVPMTQKDGLVVECWKELEHHIGCWFTPYRGVAMPGDGLLMPTYAPKRKIFFRSILRGGYIHAYVGEKSPFWSPHLRRVFSSYAFHVAAYDSFHDHLACRALYVPSLDSSGNKVKIIRQIKKIQQMQRPSLRSLYRYLPQLEGIST
jgi:hypothetical protein